MRVLLMPSAAEGRAVVAMAAWISCGTQRPAALGVVYHVFDIYDWGWVAGECGLLGAESEDSWHADVREGGEGKHGCA